MQSSLRYILTLLVLSVNIFCGKYLMLVFKLKIICSESMKYTVLVLVHSHDEFKGDTCKKRRSENAGQFNQWIDQCCSHHRIIDLWICRFSCTEGIITILILLQGSLVHLAKRRTILKAVAVFFLLSMEE